jgi:RNase P/RNase MRP subunit p29
MLRPLRFTQTRIISLMSKTYSAWLGRQVVLQIDAGESQVPLRGRVVNESTNVLRFRLEERWDVDIFKEMIVRVEADNGPALNPSTCGNSHRVAFAPHSGLMLMHDWDCALELWWSNHFSKRLCYKTILWTGLAGSILFLLALQIGVSESVSVFIRVICGFLGLVLSAVSLGCGVWLLVESPTMQAQIIPYWSNFFASFLRWLRHPIKL